MAAIVAALAASPERAPHFCASLGLLGEGDLLITSGLGGRFPPGYPVATVSTIEQDPGQAFARITATPMAKLDRSREVLLVWPGDIEATLAAQAGAAEDDQAVSAEEPQVSNTQPGDEARRQTLREMARVCEKVPAGKAETLREALFTEISPPDAESRRRLLYLGGAAFLALLSLDLIALEDIPERVTIKRVFQPDPNNRAAYDKMYRQYRMLFKKNKKIFKALNDY